MAKRLTIFLLIALLGTITFAQESNYVRCYTMENLDRLKSMDPRLESQMDLNESRLQEIINSGLAKREAENVYVIPTVVHVVYRTSAQNISDNMVLSQIRVLNEDFRKMVGTPGYNNDDVGSNTNIVFRLAQVDPDGNPTTGITRKQTTVTTFGLNDQVKFESSGGVNAWPRDKYFNIWVCNITGGILGYAQFPNSGSANTDGVVILYSAFGFNSPAAPYNKGRTATHEVGHWLGLYHIWGDGPCGVDDLVSDTPESDAANFNCPTGHTSCGSVDMIENYMDYTNDLCMNIFTDGQTQRMSATNIGFRSSLFNDPPFSTKEIHITVTDASRDLSHKQVVTFGIDDNASSGLDVGFGEVSLASSIESGFFDARFINPGDNTKASLMDLRSSSSMMETWELVFQSPSSSYPFTFEWDQTKFPEGSFRLQDQSGSIDVDMKSNSSYVLTNDSVGKLFIVYQNDLIPVELTAFTANAAGSNVTLNWTTATETNNEGYEIQRRVISENQSSEWQRVSFIAGKGTTARTSNYTYTDNLNNVNGSKVEYRLKQVDYDGTVNYSQVVEIEVVPSVYVLEQNYPNPFNPSTTLRYSLPYNSNVKVAVYNSLGESVAILVNGQQTSGFYEINFDASNLTSGMYFYTLEAQTSEIDGGFEVREVKKMLLIK